jgi:uncharacterized protein YbjT (DUF2867 family)
MANRAGSSTPGDARIIMLQMTSCTCGRPGGRRSLSKKRAKRVQASKRVRVIPLPLHRRHHLARHLVRVGIDRELAEDLLERGELGQLPEASDGVVPDDAALVQNQGVGCHLRDDLENVRAVKDHAPLGGERPHEAPQHEHRRHVETGVGLVEDEQYRIVQQGGRDEHFLAHALGVRRHRRVNVVLQVGDPGVLEPTLAGTTRLFLLSGNEKGFSTVQVEVLRAAERLVVAHVVKLSALGASDHSKSSIAREHWEVEQALQQTWMTWTILRPHVFMQNWLGEFAESVRAHGVIESPIEDGRVPFIDARDIAAVGVEALLHPEVHARQKYFLTGGEAIGLADLASALTETTGRRVTYRPISMKAARARLEAKGTPPDQIEAMLAISAYQKAGGPTSTVSDRVARILGRPPRSVRDFVRDYADRFK